MPARPLSPHLSVYKFAYTMAMSIMHRMTGVTLSVGLLLLAGWLLSMAGGPDTYSVAVILLSSWFFKLVLVAMLAAFLYHTVNGIRHLFWDAGMGLEKAQARRSSRLALLAFAVALGLCLYQFFGRTGGAS